MVDYRIPLALQCGVGLTAAVCLLLNVPGINLLLLAILIPGGIIMGRNLTLGDAPWSLLAANAAFYSVLAFVLISLPLRRVAAARLNSISLWMALPVTVMACLVCIPRFDPLFPIGMAELSKQEATLQQALPLNTTLQEARAVLDAKSVRYYESMESHENVAFQRSDGTPVKAEPGETIISSRTPTSAFSFPCGYDMWVILVFGRDGKLRERHIHRFADCP
jgi:hypothetical protein